jgi:hypothetical protein
MKKENIIGTWLLVSFELTSKTFNKKMYPYGLNPIGTLIFSADNYMTVAVMSDKREPLTVDSIQMASEQEKIRSIDTYLSYSGTWRIEDDKIFVNVMVSLLPNWTNKEHFRFFQLTDDHLTFQTPTMKQGDNEMFIELHWRKA